jgi:hypothetical protein
MHTLHFEHNSAREVYCPRCGDIYQKRKSMSTNRDDVTPPYTPKPPKPVKAPVSVPVFLSMAFLILGIVLVVVGAILTSPYVAALGIFDAIAAVAFAVLSLREKA